MCFDYDLICGLTANWLSGRSGVPGGPFLSPSDNMFLHTWNSVNSVNKCDGHRWSHDQSITDR